MNFPMAVKLVCKFGLAALLFFLVPVISYASFLRMLSTVTTEVVASEQIVKFQFEITNDGDELGRGIRIELPTLNESWPVVDSLKPKESTKAEFNIPYGKIGIGQDGTYGLAYRVHYQDAAGVSYSSSNYAVITVGVAPARALVSTIADGEASSPLRIVRELHIPVMVQNVSGREVKIETAMPFSSAEMLTTMPNWSDEGILLKPLERTSLGVLVTRIGGYVGSIYAVSVLVSGTIEGKHFFEPLSFQVRLSDPILHDRGILGLVLVGVVIVLLIQWKRKRA